MADEKKPSNINRQAVVIIHGIGEQRPMKTLRGFVNAIWKTDTYQTEGYDPVIYSTPDNISENYELRRFSTNSNKEGIITEFFEFYWAHLMEGNKVSHILAWLKRLVFLPVKRLPPVLNQIRWLFLFLIIGIFGLSLYLYSLDLNAISSNYPIIPQLLKGVAFITPIIVVPFILSKLEDIVGDAARYIDASPKNVKRRQEIRTKGVKILKELHEKGSFDRIIIVGHSLGSIIAYDILKHAFPIITQGFPKGTPLNKLSDLKNYLLEKDGHIDADKYQALQHQAFLEQKSKNNGWLVSDLITLGSPLTYSDVLLAEDKKAFNEMVQSKEFPTCPPILDKKELAFLNPKNETRYIHHAAAFALTKWTNLYFPVKALILGDAISGPMNPLFGKGVKDLPVSTTINKGLFSHTNYWKLDNENDHILILRKALNLLNLQKTEPKDTV